MLRSDSERPPIVKHLLKAALVLFWMTLFTLALVAGAKYPGNWIIYAVFTVVSNLLLYFGFRKKAIFFDAFIGVLMWLGFWLRFSIRTAFMEGYFPQARGTFDGSATAADQVLLISTCGLLALLLASIFRSRFIFNYQARASDVAHTGLFALYKDYRRPLLTAFVILVIGIAVSNAWLGIYQRGEVPRTALPFGLGGIYTWLLLFGLSSLSALILHFELAIQHRTTWLPALLGIFECFLSSVSLLSRGMILNGGALFYGVWRSLRLQSAASTFRFLVFATTLFALLFVASVLLVNHLRIPDAPKAKATSETSVATIAKSNSFVKLSGLVLDRWVGIEGVMAVANYPDRGWDLWNAAWSERYDVHKTSFFDLNLIDTPYKKVDTAKHHYVSLPGVIAFFFYPGSYAFLFAALFVLGLFAALIEISAYRLGGRNVILCALIAQVVAYRYTSFGYVPRQSYMLFGAIYINLALIWIGNWLPAHRAGKGRLANSPL